MRDIDGNLYHTVTIGTQIWMTENLKVTKFNDGTPIDIAKDLKSSKSWPYPLYCWYNNDPSDPNHYGILYNYMTVHQTYLVPLYIAPEGWHVPSDEEWNKLISYLGGSDIAGGKMKSISGWNGSDTGSTSESGFTALSGGIRFGDNPFYQLGKRGYWWSSSMTTSMSWYRYLSNYDEVVYRYESVRSTGNSVRCVKEN